MCPAIYHAVEIKVDYLIIGSGEAMAIKGGDVDLFDEAKGHEHS